MVRKKQIISCMSAVLIGPEEAALEYKELIVDIDSGSHQSTSKWEKYNNLYPCLIELTYVLDSCRHLSANSKNCR